MDGQEEEGERGTDKEGAESLCKGGERLREKVNSEGRWREEEVNRGSELRFEHRL